MVNVFRSVEVFLELVDAGFAPILPQLTEFIERLSGRRLPHATWMEIDLPWIEHADVILRLPGDSAGADIEVRHAESHGILAFSSIENLKAWRDICFDSDQQIIKEDLEGK